MKEEIEKLVAERERISLRIQEIQDNCKHPDYIIMNYSYRMGSSDVARICDICGKFIEFPTQGEIEKFQEDESKEIVYQDRVPTNKSFISMYQWDFPNPEEEN